MDRESSKYRRFKCPGWTQVKILRMVKSFLVKRRKIMLESGSLVNYYNIMTLYRWLALQNARQFVYWMFISNKNRNFHVLNKHFWPHYQYQPVSMFWKQLTRVSQVRLNRLLITNYTSNCETLVFLISIYTKSSSTT